MTPTTDPQPPAEPRWLTPEELAAWVNLARLLVLLPGALDRQLRDDAGIPHVYYRTLAVLSDSPGQSMRMTELARRCGATPSRLSHAVASLEQRGWVERRGCTVDKRGQLARLTAAGKAVLVAAAPGHAAEVHRLVFQNLTADDIARLQAITDKIMSGLRPPAARETSTTPPAELG